MLAALTGMGLSAAAGLNAYIPILVVGLLSNFTDAVTLPKEFSWLGNGWVLGIVGVLLAAEFVLDKVPVVDSVNDMIQTAIRPASGGIVFSATQAAADFDNSTWMGDHPWVGWLLGIVTALIVHTMKSTARPVINAGTVGVGGPVVSAVEDAGSISLSFVAIFLPLLVILFLIALVIIGVWGYRKIRHRVRRKSIAG
jgi:hypothetical protein